MTKKRLDLILFEHGFFETKSSASANILAHNVKINGEVVSKAGEMFDENILFNEEKPALIEIDSIPYVSRGGLKLEGALSEFGISPLGKLCIDVGASSGGFTDCLLQKGAKAVYAVDSGSGQLNESLRQDKRVICIENYNARYMNPSDFEDLFDLAVMDVSFISATYIIPSLYNCLKEGADYILLIKPQFEVGRGGLSKGGIVKDEGLRRSAIEKVTECAISVGFKLIGVTVSPIKGGDGNIEFLAHLKK